LNPSARIDGGSEPRIPWKRLWQIFLEFLGEARRMFCGGALTSLLLIMVRNEREVEVWFWFW
jgi:hypothetical protein